MSSFARISLDSLKAYSEAVNSINNYVSTPNDAESDFDTLINILNIEIKYLEEKAEQLNNAKTEIEEKIVECESRIEEIESSMDDNDYYDDENDDENDDDYENNEYENELEDLNQCLERCRSIEKEASSVLLAIDNRISILTENKNTVEKNAVEYSNEVSSVRIHTSLAISKLSKIEHAVCDYLGVQLNLVPAYEAANRTAGSKRLNEIAYMSPKFREVESRNNKDEKSHSDGIGNDKSEKIKNQDAAISRLESKGLNELSSSERGKYGEMKTDQDMRSRGYERISMDMITDETVELQKGIDGVFYCESKIPQYAIVESKFGSSQLNPNTADGKQMSTKWILNNRLEDAVGKDMADIIIEQMLLNPDNVGCYEARVDYSGNVTYSELDSDANIVKEGVQL